MTNASSVVTNVFYCKIPSSQVRRDLEAKVGVVTLISQHLQVVLWFHGVGMLPEHSGKLVVLTILLKKFALN